MAARRKPKPKKPAPKPKKAKGNGLASAVAVIRKKLSAALGQRLLPEDVPAFEVLCSAMAALNRSMKEVEREPIVTMPNECRAVNPHWKLVDLNRRIVADGLTRFGLSPLDRARNEKAGAEAPAPPSSTVPKREASQAEKEDDDLENLLRNRPSTLPMTKRDAS